MIAIKTLTFKTTWSSMGQATRKPEKLIVEFDSEGTVAFREGYWRFIIPNMIFDKIINERKALSKRLDIKHPRET